MLYEIMLHIRNLFPADIGRGNEYTIEGGTISLPFVKNGQYFLIEGSDFNDGVYKYPCTTLKNETFFGYITPLKPPAAFLQLAEEIKEYKTKEVVSAYTSESFGGYTYSKATGANGAPASWKDVYKSRLDTWRKL